MKHIKLWESFSDYLNQRETPPEIEGEKLYIQIWSVPYEVIKKGDKYTMENMFGMDGIDSLKRSNPHNEPSGDFSDAFGVYIEEDNITITLYDSLLEDHEGDDDEALAEAVEVIENYYNSVGWEFLHNKRN